MKLPNIETVDSQDEARELAIKWQHWFSDNSISYGELVEYQQYFIELADKFPDLVEEFGENGII